MKAPLRADSSLIEKLRFWLSTELEPLEIDNNVQYAHHVVTIFLNDADVEDEPLSPPDDYLRELDNLRTGKSLDQKKRAAVQFLKGVIPFDKQPIPSLIEQLIDELVDRVEATKVRTPRKLLCPISLNVEASRRQTFNRKQRIGQERCYDEAFPSLPAETKMNNAVTLTVKKNACADGWLKSSTGIENMQRNRRRSAARKITFVDKSEDAVCVRTGLLHLVPVPDTSLSSPVTIQVDESSLETGIFSGGALRHHYESEWKSAFVKVLPTAKLYSPKKIRFPLPLDVSSPAKPNSWPFITIVSNDGSGQSSDLPRVADVVDLLDKDSPKAFIHVEHKAPGLPPNNLFALDADDLEVSNAISWDRINQEQMRQRKNELAQVKRQENHVSSNRKENRNRHRDSNQTKSGLNRSGDGQSTPPRGADNSEVKTDDLIGFAMSQMAQFARSRSGTDGNRQQGSHEGPRNGQDAFDIVLPVPEENELAIVIGMDNDGRRGSTDSGMCPGGEDESVINLINWAGDEGSPSGWLESASVWRKAAITALHNWRKTPGCVPSDNGVGGQSLSALQSDHDGAGCQKETEERMNWNGWEDPISVPGSSWDSMIRKDVFHLSTPPTIKSQYVPNAGNVFGPPELATTVNENVAQVLQSAFVNSLFAQGTAADPLTQIQSSHTALDCSELEQRWLSYRSEESVPVASRSRLNVVRGRTCSNWLEGICHLGIECPFSHPR